MTPEDLEFLREGDLVRKAGVTFVVIANHHGVRVVAARGNIIIDASQWERNDAVLEKIHYLQFGDVVNRVDDEEEEFLIAATGSDPGNPDHCEALGVQAIVITPNNASQCERAFKEIEGIYTWFPPV